MKVPITEVRLGETFKFENMLYKRVYANLPYDTKYIMVIGKPGEDGEHITFFDDLLGTLVEVDRPLTFAEIKEGNKFCLCGFGILVKVKGFDGNMVGIDRGYVYHIDGNAIVEYPS